MFQNNRGHPGKGSACEQVGCRVLQVAEQLKVVLSFVTNPIQ